MFAHRHKPSQRNTLGSKDEHVSLTSPVDPRLKALAPKILLFWYMLLEVHFSPRSDYRCWHGINGKNKTNTEIRRKRSPPHTFLTAGFICHWKSLPWLIQLQVHSEWLRNRDTNHMESLHSYNLWGIRPCPSPESLLPIKKWGRLGVGVGGEIMKRKVSVEGNIFIRCWLLVPAWPDRACVSNREWTRELSV